MLRILALSCSVAVHAGMVWLVLPEGAAPEDHSIKGADAFEVAAVDPASLRPVAPPILKPPAPKPPILKPPALKPPVLKPPVLKPPVAAAPDPAPGRVPGPTSATPPVPPQPKARETPVPPAVAGGATRSAPQKGLSDEDKAALAAWQRRLALTLNEHKTYPREARAARHEGEVIVLFTIDPTGRITDRAIQESSGHTDLDHAALAVFDRVGRLPAPPDGVVNGRLRMAVPFRYAMAR